MKKILLSIVLSAACALPARVGAAPQNDEKNVNISDTRVALDQAGAVDVSFLLRVGENVADRGRSMVIYPVLEGDGSQLKLSPVVVRGRRAGGSRGVAAERRAMSAAGLDPGASQVTQGGRVVQYRASVPYQNWMSGSRLVLGGLNVGKKGATDVNIGTVANDLLVVAMPAAPTTPAYVNDFASRPQLQQQMPQPVPVAAAPVSPIGAHERGVVVQRSIYPSLPSPAAAGGYWVGTIGDKLAARFTFVEHVSRFNEARVSSASNAVFDYNMPLVFGTSVPREESDTSRFVEMTREGAVHVAFRPSSNVMERYLGENNTSSVDLLSAIRLIDGTPDTRVAQVVVVGFSSPEGTNDEKQSYAMERAMAVRDYLTANSHIDPGVISVYNGSVDWTTLRALVAESNMAQKYTVLDIIDNAPAWDAARGKGRLDRLMAIDGGKTYRYMREKFFPLIRQTGAYVKVYYENR